MMAARKRVGAAARCCLSSAATQGDWSNQGMAERYAENRSTFQDWYARECWQRLSTKIGADRVASARRVVDIGCGTGDFTAELAGLLSAEVSGIDLFEDMVAHARRAYPELQFHKADLTRERFKRDQDIATSFMALHWPGPNPAFVEGVKSLLRPGGVFCAGFPGVGSTQQGVDALEAVMRSPEFAAYFPADPSLDTFPTMFHREQPESWGELLRQSGFQDVDARLVTYHTPYVSEDACFKRLIAAWPPILSPAYLPADLVGGFLRQAARVMWDSRYSCAPSSGDDDRQAPVAYMTSHLVEFTASLPR